MSPAVSGSASRFSVDIDEKEFASAQRAARLMSEPGSTYTFSAYRDVAALARFVLSLDLSHDRLHHHAP